MVLCQSSIAFVEWAPERPILGNPTGIQGCSQRHHQLESPQRPRVCTISQLHSWLDSLAEAPEMSNSQQQFINLLHFVRYSSSYRSAADKSSSDFGMVHPELLWAIPLETEGSVSKALCDYFHLHMPGCEEITQSNLFTWKCHNLIFSTPVRSRKTVRNFSTSAEKLKLRFGVGKHTLNWSLTWVSVLHLSSEIPHFSWEC